MNILQESFFSSCHYYRKNIKVSYTTNRQPSKVKKSIKLFVIFYSLFVHVSERRRFFFQHKWKKIKNKQHRWKNSTTCILELTLARMARMISHSHQCLVVRLVEITMKPTSKHPYGWNWICLRWLIFFSSSLSRVAQKSYWGRAMLFYDRANIKHISFMTSRLVSIEYSWDQKLCMLRYSETGLRKTIICN